MGRVALGIAVVDVIGWVLVMGSGCSGGCTGSSYTAWQIGGVIVYVTTAALIVLGVAALVRSLLHWTGRHPLGH